jgi:hypothetical protein
MHLFASDRRTQIRFKASLEVVDGRLGLQAFTRDVSTDGMFIRVLPYRVGDRIAVEISFPDLTVPLHVVGDVVRVDPGNGVAVRLLHPSEPQRLNFSGAIARLAEAKTEPGI